MIRRRGVLLTSLKIAKAYWLSEEKWLAWGLLLGVITLNLGVVYIVVLLNDWKGNFYEVIQNYNYSGFLNLLLQYAFLASCLIVIKGYQVYARLNLHIRWRRWMTERYLTDWLYNKTYYQLQLTDYLDKNDNPDQRISEDIELFVWFTLKLSLDLLQDIVTIVSFVIILWDLSGVLDIYIGKYCITIYGYLVWAALIYAFVGTYWTMKLGRPLINLDVTLQRYEADFRFSLMRLRENAESIALYAGEKQEQQNFRQRFKKIIGTYFNIMVVRKRLMWLTASYNQVSAIFASLVAAPRYFSNSIHLGQMFQIVDAYSHVQNGFSFVVDSFTQIAHWRAVVNRLNNFLLNMEMVRNQPLGRHTLETYKEAINEYRINNLTVLLPKGDKLIQDFTFTLKPGEAVIIIGPSGCGKSTLLRTLAGIWPYAAGKMIVPAGQKIMFVPQKSYMPIAALRDVLLYPGIAQVISDACLQQLLTKCKLVHLIDKLDIVSDWAQALSLGEQQRIAVVRILLQKPKWLFLDEVTSALDESTEAYIYQMIQKELQRIAIVSVGHRHTLLNYHTAKLVYDGVDNWRFSKINKI